MGVPVSPEMSKFSYRERIEACLLIMEDMEDVDNWEDLPGQITALIRDQPGLRFDGEPIRSREDLELAYRLPRNFVQESTDNPEMLELSKLAILVLLAYRKMICRDRREQVIDVIIHRHSLRCSFTEMWVV